MPARIQYPVVDRHEVNRILVQKDNGDVAVTQTTADLRHIRTVTLQYIVPANELHDFLDDLETRARACESFVLETPGYNIWGDETDGQNVWVVGYSAPVRNLAKRYQVEVTYRRADTEM